MPFSLRSLYHLASTAGSCEVIGELHRIGKTGQDMAVITESGASSRYLPPPPTTSSNQHLPPTPPAIPHEHLPPPPHHLPTSPPRPPHHLPGEALELKGDAAELHRWAVAVAAVAGHAVSGYVWHYRKGKGRKKRWARSQKRRE